MCMVQCPHDPLTRRFRPALGRKTAWVNSKGVKPARKTVIGVRKITKAARKLDLDARPGRKLTTGSGARKRDAPEVLSDEGDRSSEDIIELTDSSSNEDIDELLDAFNALTLTAARLQQRRRLPFLPRNLRMGFESRCRTFRVPIGPEDFPKFPVKVVYRYAVEDSESEDSDIVILNQEPKFQEFVGMLTKWACPLCELHKPFRNRAMLAYHLKKDHSEAQISWDELRFQNVSNPILSGS